MKVNIEKGAANGTAYAPASKSMIHRAIICSALCKDGISFINNVSFSDDVMATVSAVSNMGATVVIEEEALRVKGVGGSDFDTDKTIFCRESGSTLRFIIPILLLCKEEVTFTGQGRLLSRPLSVYRDICREQNLLFKINGDYLKLKGPLKSGIFTIPADISSQFVSGLLFALPLLNGDSEIRLIGTIESKPYIDMTIDMLNRFGINVFWKEKNLIFIKGRQKYRSSDIVIEGDYSNASFLDAFNYLGSNVKILGLANKSLQGDKIYKKYFELLESGKHEMSLAQCPDLGPILMVLSAFKNGAVFTDTKRLRIKESDRALSMAEELRKIGVDVKISENSIEVYKSAIHRPKEVIDSHNDHRIAMSMAIALTKTGGSITNCQTVRKSFPNFFKVLNDLGINMGFEEQL